MAEYADALADYPNLVEVGGGHVAEVGYDYEAEFLFGLDVLLDGLERLRCPGGPRGRHALPLGGVDAQDLDRCVSRRAEPVRLAGVELGDLAGLQSDVVLAQDQPHLARQDVEPFVAGVAAEPALALGMDHHLPHRHAAGLLGERIHEPLVAGSRPGPDPGIAHPRRADELVERQVVDLGERQEQFEARSALRFPGATGCSWRSRFRGDLRERQIPSFAQSSEPWPDLSQYVGDVGHGSTLSSRLPKTATELAIPAARSQPHGHGLRTS